MLSGLGDALRSTGQRRRSPAARGEDDGDGGSPGLPASRGSTERRRRPWQGSWTGQ